MNYEVSGDLNSPAKNRDSKLMSVVERIIESKKLDRSNNVKLCVPDTGKELYPVVYLQHGLGDDEQVPWERTNLEAYAAELELIVVTADAEASWFVNDEREGGESNGGCYWEDYFVFELPAYIEENFPAAASASGRGQCGFSMGGYGAMMYTLLHPDRFAAAAVHSGSFIFGHEYRKDRPERAEFMAAVAPPGGRYDLFALCESDSSLRQRQPAIRFNVGDRDHLLDQNRKFHACLEENQIEHDYIENKGSHHWAYVEENLLDSLRFLKSNLKV